MSKKRREKSKEMISREIDNFDEYTTSENMDICYYIAQQVNSIVDDSKDWGILSGTPCVYIDHDGKPLMRVRLRKSFISLNIHKTILLNDKYKTRKSDSYVYAINEIYGKENSSLHELCAAIKNSLGIIAINDNCYPEYEEDIDKEYIEGGRKSITVNCYERDSDARRKCIEYYGSTKCQICGFDSAKYYGEEFQGLIHVHHIVPISERGGEYKLDPKRDLIPVCPNCHMILHSNRVKKYDWQYIKEMLKDRESQ